MVTHPHRGKIYPDTTLEDKCREAGATVRLMWEVPGPKNTGIAFIACYLIGTTACLVETFKGGGWDAFTPNQSNNIVDAVNDVLSRCGSTPSVTKD